jgi:hypothetical protein
VWLVEFLNKHDKKEPITDADWEEWETARRGDLARLSERGQLFHDDIAEDADLTIGGASARIKKDAVMEPAEYDALSA